jgi:hypothetical protein
MWHVVVVRGSTNAHRVLTRKHLFPERPELRLEDENASNGFWLRTEASGRLRRIRKLIFDFHKKKNEAIS